MRVRVHVAGIKGSGRIQKGEEATALFHGVLEVDGHLIEEVGHIDVSFSGNGFAEVRPHLIPGFFEVVVHDEESWPLLLNRCEEARRAASGTGRLVAISKED